MKPDIVIAYIKAVVGSAIRLGIAFALIVAINLHLVPDLLNDPEAHRKIVFALEWLRAHSATLGVMVILALTVLPWIAFHIVQLRYKGIEANALLPLQQRELDVAVSRQDALALAEQVLREDPAVYGVRVDAGTHTLTARATPLRDPYGTFGKYLHARAADHAARHGTASSSWPYMLLRGLDLLRTSSSPRGLAVTVSGDEAHATIALQSRLTTLLPAVDKLACGQRQLHKLADAIALRVQPLVASRREQSEKAQLQNRLLDARLQVLRAQVEPHFLYNSLANVQYLIRNDAPAAEAMLSALIDYLRHALPRMREATSTLGEEVALARSYLDVLRIRMGGRLGVSVDVPPALASHPFPPLLLISLVENAIKHGLEPKPGAGQLTIAARQDGQSLHVSVRDDGVGFGSAGGTGIGLRNIRETLASLFGHSGKLTVEPGEHGGVTATIEVPLPVAQAVPLATATGTL
jgi:signal transduction histidine kinase